MPRPLKVSRNPAYDPPEGLSERSQTLWRDIVPSRGNSPGRLALLTEALRSLDRADECRAIVQAEGLIAKTESTGALHAHPATKLEKDSRSQFLQAWAALHLAWGREDSIG